MCEVENETVSYTVSECKMLDQKEHKRDMTMYAGIFTGDYVKKHRFQGAPQLYEHESDRVIENEVYKILWDFTTQDDIKIEARRPGIVIIDKTEKELRILDVTIPGDVRVNEREIGKSEKYQILKAENLKIWDIKKVTLWRCFMCNIV